MAYEVCSDSNYEFRAELLSHKHVMWTDGPESKKQNVCHCVKKSGNPETRVVLKAIYRYIYTYSLYFFKYIKIKDIPSIYILFYLIV